MTSSGGGHTLDVPDDVARAWPCYRLVLERLVTWTDLQHMTIDDVDRLNIAANAWNAAGHAPRE